jgi:DEAD/DEAH box helicase domain-containing protein
MKDFLVFDLETQRSAQDVGGWQNIPEMKLSVGVIWDSRDKKYHYYYHDDAKALYGHLISGPLVVGYNHMGFDYPVIGGYFSKGPQRDEALKQLKAAANFDLLIDIKELIGKRIKLDSVARATLNIGKSADGLLALKWYQEYLAGDVEKLQMIADYCQVDVQVTRDVYIYGRDKGFISYIDKVLGLKKIEVNWSNDENKKNTIKVIEPVQLSF